ncbi:tyrosine-type recombinase/integrase [Limnoglobus roseus]|uniref:Site-specific integrase n=1 Tax=Limnoglobus roseus TaxID=2598579 RepID=A0A5C1ABT0_9BACT|nr:tyrosine-type recombinase/integrase [Limnoglobus roseus]QEL15633.1 site-specific integrase [Limnoglobus roseus]
MLATVREDMVRRGWCRRVVNYRFDRVRRCIKWAVSQEMLPGDRYEALRTLGGLRRGRTPARESDPVLPVGEGDYRATLPHMPRVLRGMAELQRWTAMRPGDVCKLRPAEVDRTGGVWVYEPKWHKGTHRGKRRAVHLGPRAQAILLPFLAASKNPQAYLFSPAEAVAEMLAARTAKRKTPPYPSHLKRNEEKRKADRKRPPGDRYTADSYGKAVLKAVKRANQWWAKMAAGAAFDPIPAWAPNQLRHLRGAEVRKAFGLEAAQVLLGHARADVTQVYAERDFALAAKVAAETG